MTKILLANIAAFLLLQWYLTGFKAEDDQLFRNKHIKMEQHLKDSGRLRDIIIKVTDEVVDTVNTFSYPKFNNKDVAKRILYRTPVYKVIVSGTDSIGNELTRSFNAIRFGVKNRTDGAVKTSYMQGIESGLYKRVPWTNYYISRSFKSSEKGAWVITPKYLIHDGPDPEQLGASNGCIELLGNRGFDEFNNFIIWLSGSAKPRREMQLSEIGLKGIVTVIYEKAKTPPLKVSVLMP